VVALQATAFNAGVHDCSLTQGRLFAQLTALRKSRCAPILLLEGDPLRVGHSQMHPASIRGALSYIAAILGAPILPEPRT